MLLVASVLTTVTRRWLETGTIVVIILLHLVADWLQQNEADKSPSGRLITHGLSAVRCGPGFCTLPHSLIVSRPAFFVPLLPDSYRVMSRGEIVQRGRSETMEADGVRELVTS